MKTGWEVTENLTVVRTIDAASEPMMVMDEDAMKPREAAQTAVADKLALDFQ